MTDNPYNDTQLNVTEVIEQLEDIANEHPNAPMVIAHLDKERPLTYVNMHDDTIEVG